MNELFLYIILVTAPAGFYLLKSRMWLPMADSCETCMSYPCRNFGNHLVKYFSLFGQPLAFIIYSFTYGR